MQIGFIGLGLMGEPMALNLVNAGIPLLVWNRSSEKYKNLVPAGAQIAGSVDALFNQAEIIILMLANAEAIDSVLGRNSPAFQKYVAGRIIVNMGTTSPEYSQTLEKDIELAGGSYIEVPVSGSRKPAEAGELVAMAAGNPEQIERIRPLLQAMCRKVFNCGPVPNALLMKLSVNLFLISMVTGLAESFHFAEQQGLDLKQWQAILNTGPMASSVSTVKAAKLSNQDFIAQASISDVLMNNRLIFEAARTASIASPLLDVCFNLYSEAEDLGQGQSDMIAVLEAIQKRTQFIKD